MTRLIAYADHSGSNTHPVSVLAGWIADEQTWISFRKEWDQILRMSPRIDYFKFDEATRLTGEFFGISEEMRDEKMRLFARCINDHKLLGIRCTVEHDSFHKFFGKQGSGALRTPYPVLFVQLVTRIFREYIKIGPPYPKIDFVFDEQVNEEEAAVSGWHEMKKDAVEPVSSMLGSPPSFRSDKNETPLQAADLIAGWSRYINGQDLLGNKINYPEWSNILEHTRVIYWHMNDSVAQNLHYHLKQF